MNYIKNLISNKSKDFHALSTTVQEIFQIFLHSEKSVATKEGLAKVLSFFQADRIYIGYFNDKDSTISFIHESTAKGVNTATGLLNKQFSHEKIYAESDYPLWIGNIKNGIDTVISDIDRMPMISVTEIPLMIENNVKSSITSSIHQNGKVCGFLGLEFVNRKHKWEQTDIENIHFFANIFSVVIENEYMHKEIISSSLEAFKNDKIFQIIFETLPVGIELYDEKGYLRKVNPYDLELLGTTEEKVLGVNLFENPNIAKEAIEQIKRGEPTIFENDYHFDNDYFASGKQNQIIRLIGNCSPLKDMDNNIFGYLELVHHDTSYYKTKEEIRSNLAKLHMAVDAQNAFFWEYDVKNDISIIDFNSMDALRKERLREFQEAYKVGRMSHAERVHPDDIEELAIKAKQMLKGEINSFKQSYKEYINGNLRWVTTCFQTFKYDEEGKPEIIVCLTTDITEQRKRDIELIQTKEFNKIRSAFISNISHEIRTPLNAILGFTKIITDSNTAEENQYLNDMVEQNNEILLHMIDSILSFSKIEAGPLQYQKEDVDIKELCRAAFNLKLATKKPEIEFIFEDSNLPFIVYTDRSYTRQAIYHLLDNANKFTERGTVTLSYRKNKEGHAHIEVADTGIGMTPEEISKIFDQFYKGDQFQRGVGLGLSIARRFIQDLGGKVGVESVKGSGSTFWLTLPCEMQENV